MFLNRRSYRGQAAEKRLPGRRRIVFVLYYYNMYTHGFCNNYFLWRFRFCFFFSPFFRIHSLLGFQSALCGGSPLYIERTENKNPFPHVSRRLLRSNILPVRDIVRCPKFNRYRQVLLFRNIYIYTHEIQK